MTGNLYSLSEALELREGDKRIIRLRSYTGGGDSVQGTQLRLILLVHREGMLGYTHSEYDFFGDIALENEILVVHPNLDGVPFPLGDPRMTLVDEIKNGYEWEKLRRE